MSEQDAWSALVVGPDDHLFVNLGEDCTDHEAKEFLSTLRERLPKSVHRRVVLVAAKEMAVLRADPNEGPPPGPIPTTAPVTDHDRAVRHVFIPLRQAPTRCRLCAAHRSDAIHEVDD